MNDESKVQEQEVIIRRTDGTEAHIDVMDSDNTGVSLETGSKTDDGGLIAKVITVAAVIASAIIGWFARGAKDKAAAKKAAKEAEQKEMEELRKLKEQLKKDAESAVEVKAEDIKPEEPEKKPEKTK